MSTPSLASEKGLSIQVSVPLVIGDEVISNVTPMSNSYTHKTSAEGGYTEASFRMAGNNEFIEDWLQYGLGRDIKVFGPAGQVIWEGFVNEVKGNFGYATFTRGPLINIANRVVVWYTPIHDLCAEVGSPLYDPACREDGELNTGTPFPTDEVDDVDSQMKYGIWEKVVNIGECYQNDTVQQADDARDLYIAENANPEWNPSLSLSGSAGELSVEVNCRGYIDWLTAYVYNNLDPKEWDYLSEIIKAVLGADPNHVFSTDYAMIAENLQISGTEFTDEKLAKTIIDDLLACGGGDNDRWTFGIYKDRKAHYEAIPTEVEYIYYKTGKAQQVETLSRQKVEPWDVLPCKWAAIPTFLASFPFKLSNIREDPRIFFVEEIVYTAPDQISLTGAKIRKLNQYLASIGLSGV